MSLSSPDITKEAVGELRALGELDGKFMNLLETERVNLNAQHPQCGLQSFVVLFVF